MKLKGESHEGKGQVKAISAMRNKEDDRLLLSGVYRVSGGCRALQKAIRLALRWLDEVEDMRTSGARHARGGNKSEQRVVAGRNQMAQ
jgi:hypothetical protein